MKKQIAAGLLTVLLMGCAGSTTQLTPTAAAPQAVGTVELEKSDNKNTVGRLEVKHLAPPENLGNGETVYVTWVRPTGTPEWQNVGQLVIDEDRSGRLDLVVPYSEFDLFVTAEQSGEATQPGDLVVLRGQVSQQQ